MELLVGQAVYGSNRLFPAGALFIATVLIYFADERLEKQPRRSKRELVDKATGQTVILRRRDQLFFIDMKWWPYIIGVCGVLAAVSRPS